MQPRLLFAVPPCFLLALTVSCAPDGARQQYLASGGLGGERPVPTTGGAGSGSGGGNFGGATSGGAPVIIVDNDAATAEATLLPQDVAIDVTIGTPLAPVQFTVQGVGRDLVQWESGNPLAGFVDEHGLYTPSGKVGGVVEVRAIIGGRVLTTMVAISLRQTQNGGAVNAGGPGAGGLGGVGGEGEGPAVSSEIRARFDGQPTSAARSTWLYPYDRTVFPLGILPPLLQWSAAEPVDAVSIRLHAQYYDYTGYFARPLGVPAGMPFVRHPIPRDVWDAATRTAAGGTLEVALTFSSGDRIVGPIIESWPIALAPFNGVVYYEAYATELAKNYDDLTVWGERFGGATLSIAAGAESPQLVAGTNSADSTGCRACHTVSAFGDLMLAQHGESYTKTSSYNLRANNLEQARGYPDGFLAGAGLSPDGTLALTDNFLFGGVRQGIQNSVAQLYELATGTPLATTGLSSFATKVSLPAFSPDGKRVAFGLLEGSSTPAVGPADGRRIAAMDFDATAKDFSNPILLWNSTDDKRPAFLSFTPTNTGLIFQRSWGGREPLETRYGARGDIWWVDLATRTATPLQRLNGTNGGQSYLPTSDNQHQDDETLNYQPSVSPVASGGYAWVVFMSRRLYGNVAVAPPWDSDPREHDIRKNTTTKKIWMAAVNLNAKAGEDPSHPAFYVPGQELGGSNSRPFFALQPCLSDRATCSTGVDCCSGYCRSGFCVSPPQNSCALISETCSAASDCCDRKAQCIGSRCSIVIE